MKIGLFDSGIGGLNVLNEFIKKYPNNEYIYYGDTKNIPYGEKDKDTLLKLSINIIKFFEEKKVDLIIIACGTISSNCYLELSSITNIPIYDIISPTIKYLKNINSKKLLFATNKTVSSHIFKNNLSNIVEIATSEFVSMIETSKIDSQIIKKYLKNYFDIDYLILGCTHYPLLVNEFKKYLKNDVKYVDMGKVLVDSLKITNNGNYKLSLYFTKIDDILKSNIKKIINNSYELYKIQ